VLIESGANWLIQVIVGWILGAAALFIAARIVPGIKLRDFGAALSATIVIAIVDGAAGPAFRFLAWPASFLTLGLFLLAVNAVLLKLASWFVSGLQVRGYRSAVIGSAALTLISAILRFLVLH
jgi:putative membrane protein